MVHTHAFYRHTLAVELEPFILGEVDGAYAERSVIGIHLFPVLDDFCYGNIAVGIVDVPQLRIVDFKPEAGGCLTTAFHGHSFRLYCRNLIACGLPE